MIVNEISLVIQNIILVLYSFKRRKKENNKRRDKENEPKGREVSRILTTGDPIEAEFQ